MNEAHKHYYEALQRLIDNKPAIVPKNTKITNDSVSEEAGRGKGSIKSGRESFKPLVEAIREAAVKQFESANVDEIRTSKLKEKAASLQTQLDNALVREMSLVYELFETKKRIAKLTDEKVIPIRTPLPK